MKDGFDDSAAGLRSPFNASLEERDQSAVRTRAEPGWNDHFGPTGQVIVELTRGAQKFDVVPSPPPDFDPPHFAMRWRLC
jgi:hypothetical protein